MLAFAQKLKKEGREEYSFCLILGFLIMIAAAFWSFFLIEYSIDLDFY